MVDVCGWDVDVGIGDGDGAHQRYGVRVPCRSSERYWNWVLHGWFFFDYPSDDSWRSDVGDGYGWECSGVADVDGAFG